MLVPFGANMGGNEESVEQVVRREIRKDRKRRQEDDSDAKLMQTFSNMNTMTVINAIQQALISHLSAPPIDPVTNLPVAALANPPNFGNNERAVLKWTANGVLLLLQNTYNLISALRAEAMMGFLVNGLSTSHKNGGGLFGGGLMNLLVLSSLTGGGFGLSALFGGGPNMALIGATTRWLP